MMGGELLPKRSPDKNQRLFMINGIYYFKYPVRNSLPFIKCDDQLDSMFVNFIWKSCCSSVEFNALTYHFFIMMYIFCLSSLQPLPNALYRRVPARDRELARGKYHLIPYRYRVSDLNGLVTPNLSLDAPESNPGRWDMISNNVFTGSITVPLQ